MHLVTSESVNASFEIKILLSNSWKATIINLNTPPTPPPPKSLEEQYLADLTLTLVFPWGCPSHSVTRCASSLWTCWPPCWYHRSPLACGCPPGQYRRSPPPPSAPIGPPRARRLRSRGGPAAFADPCHEHAFDNKIKNLRSQKMRQQIQRKIRDNLQE